MTQETPSHEDPETSYLVIELEAEDGSLTEFVLVDTLNVDECEYAMLIPLARVPDLDQLPFEEWSAEEQDQFISILRVEGERYFEPAPEELERLNGLLDQMLSEQDDG